MNGRTLRILLLALFPVGIAAQDRAATKVLKGPEERVSITVPADWKPMEIAGTMLLRAIAPGAYGGHDIRIEREEGQGDVDKQRDRYLDYDAQNAPDATVQKKSKPYFGYRINDTDANRVLIRAFVADGSDGLIITCTSRFQYYDKLWARKIEEVIASLQISGSALTSRPELEGDLRRLFDRSARASFVAPGVWKSLTPQFDDELLFVCLKGSKTGPRFTLKEYPGKSNTGLLLLKVGGEWKRSYANVSIKRLGGQPPRMIIKNRVPGSVDYVQAFASEGDGYVFMLTVREGSFEKFKTVADQFAQSLVFTGGPFVPPVSPDDDIRETYKRLVAVNASAESAGAAETIVKVLSGFDKHWSRIGVAISKNAAPVEIVVASEDKFAETSHFFGDPPVAYDRSRRMIVATPPPKSAEQLVMWRGQLYSALAENLLHRDLKVAAPTWWRAGVMTCMDAAGRSGKGPDEPHPAFVERLVVITDTDAHKPLSEIFAMTEAEFLLADSPDMRIQAWGYTHLMIYGRGTLASLYKRWKKALVKATGKAPKFDLKKYDKAQKDLKKHVFQRWGR